ncbi:hypothetical protein FRB93_003426 [Tulasnella sp. JGI-2019a]|nr:hypothetical protein FRB93_003426 [Tulasnella sp. JGI-2019a]
MRSSTSIGVVVGALVAAVNAQVYCGVNITQARLDTSINWSAVPFTDAAFAYMANLSLASGVAPPANATGIDMHSHMVFPWYGAAVPLTAGLQTPTWSTDAHLTFAATYAINHTVLAASVPSANIYPNNQAATVTTARLINLSLAVLSSCRPQSFSFFAAVPLPFTTAAITEANYAIDTLHASGIAVMSNHEGIYLGNSQIAPFFAALNNRPEAYTIVYIHPNVPYLRQNGGAVLVEANPTRYISGLFEFFYDTARVLMDLTMANTLKTYTKINLIAAHCGGTFPEILDRMLKSTGDTTFEQLHKSLYASRIWWDSAGPEYPRQVQSLLPFVPQSQLVLGSDYPYAPAVSYPGAFLGLNTDTAVNLPAIKHDNAIALLGNRLRWYK